MPSHAVAKLGLDPQLICYSWISGICDVAIVVFVRKSIPEIQYLKAACGSTTGLTDYYCERLQLWQDLFAGHESVAQVAVLAAASA